MEKKYIDDKNIFQAFILYLVVILISQNLRVKNPLLQNIDSNCLQLKYL